MSEQKENLFPTLGEIATRTDALKDLEDDDVRLNEDGGARVEQEEGEEREMQEMESLCMRCHEQVSCQSSLMCCKLTSRSGRDTITTDNHTIFQGDRCLIFPV